MSTLYAVADNVRFQHVGEECLLDRNCFGAAPRGLSASTRELRGGCFSRVADGDEAAHLSSVRHSPGHEKFIQFKLYRCAASAWDSKSWRPRADPTLTDPGHVVISPELIGPDDAFELHSFCLEDPTEREEGGFVDAVVEAAMPKVLHAMVPHWNWVGAVCMKAQADALWEHLPDSQSDLKTVAYALRAVEEGHEDGEKAVVASYVAAKIKEQLDAGCDNDDVRNHLGPQELQIVRLALDFVIFTDDCEQALAAVGAVRAWYGVA